MCIRDRSVNTLSNTTAVVRGEDVESEVCMFNPTMRVGQHESVIDNFSAGGISELIDPVTGVVFTDVEVRK